MFWNDGSYYSGMWEKGNQSGEGEYVNYWNKISVKKENSQNLVFSRKIYL